MASRCNVHTDAGGTSYTTECRTLSASGGAVTTLQTRWKYDNAAYGYTNWANFSNYSCPYAAPSPCTGMASASIYLDGQVYQGSGSCVRGPVQSDGSQAMCGLAVQPVSAPVFNPNRNLWETYVATSPTGSICSLGAPSAGGKVVGPSTLPAQPVPPVIPDPVPATNTAPPSVCTTASCYDSKSDQYCGSSGGAQFCVSGSSARGGAGACASGTDATMCAGSPTAPTPAAANVPDPPTAIKSSDKFTQKDPVTGATIPVNVVVFSQTGTPTNGAKTGDSVPAPASTSPTPATTAKSYGGGTDCKTPPACSGDAVMCGAARTQWATTCQVHKDLAGDTAPPRTAAQLASGSPYNQASLWPDAAPSNNPVADAANAGNYDQSGFAGGGAGECPMHDIAVPLWAGKTFDLPLSKGCTPLGWLRYLVIGFALFQAAKVTMGSNA
jgi:hypothetical protein